MTLDDCIVVMTEGMLCTFQCYDGDIDGWIRVGDGYANSSNHAMELMASRCTIQLSMSSNRSSTTTHAPALGSSSCSR